MENPAHWNRIRRSKASWGVSEQIEAAKIEREKSMDNWVDGKSALECVGVQVVNWPVNCTAPDEKIQNSRVFRWAFPELLYCDTPMTMINKIFPHANIDDTWFEEWKGGEVLKLDGEHKHLKGTDEFKKLEQVVNDLTNKLNLLKPEEEKVEEENVKDPIDKLGYLDFVNVGGRDLVQHWKQEWAEFTKLGMAAIEGNELWETLTKKAANDADKERNCGPQLLKNKDTVYYYCPGDTWRTKMMDKLERVIKAINTIQMLEHPEVHASGVNSPIEDKDVLPRWKKIGLAMDACGFHTPSMGKTQEHYFWSYRAWVPDFFIVNRIFLGNMLFLYDIAWSTDSNGNLPSDVIRELKKSMGAQKAGVILRIISSLKSRSKSVLSNKDLIEEARAHDFCDSATFYNGKVCDPDGGEYISFFVEDKKNMGEDNTMSSENSSASSSLMNLILTKT